MNRRHVHPRPDHGFAVASANYRAIPRHFDDFVNRACPVVGSYGAKDRTLRGRPGSWRTR